MAAYYRKYQQENREKVTKYKREYHLKHKERENEKSRKYYQNNRAKLIQYQKEYRTNNREKSDLWNEKGRLRRKYGLSIEQFRSFLEKRNGKCDACGKNRGKGRLVVDHCHNTGVVRGLICAKCNTAIGFLDEDPVLAQRLADYVAKFALLSRKVA